ncbi:MAG: hypothetical protein ACHQNA_04320 [Acidimicrobiales bacterium]
MVSRKTVVPSMAGACQAAVWVRSLTADDRGANPTPVDTSFRPHRLVRRPRALSSLFHNSYDDPDDSVKTYGSGPSASTGSEGVLVALGLAPADPNAMVPVATVVTAMVASLPSPDPVRPLPSPITVTGTGITRS